jgi:hypothetical protein
MRASKILNTFRIIGIVLLSGCTTQGTVPESGLAGKSAVGADITPADPHLDHVFAWIPRDRAKTAAVAEALVHIELGRAMGEVGKTLCGGGWPINGPPVESFGPWPAMAPPALGGYPAWYYHLSQKPGFAGCAAVPNAALYRELDARLPPWISVRAATPQISSRSGGEIAATVTGR